MFLTRLINQRLPKEEFEKKIDEFVSKNSECFTFLFNQTKWKGFEVKFLKDEEVVSLYIELPIDKLSENIYEADKVRIHIHKRNLVEKGKRSCWIMLTQEALNSIFTLIGLYRVVEFNIDNVNLYDVLESVKWGYSYQSKGDGK